MSSSLVLTESIIDDTDLCLTKLRDFSTSEKLSAEESFSDDNYCDNEMVVTIDATTSEELELMKSFGLPIGFTSRSTNKRSDKRSNKKNKNKFKSKTCSQSNDSVKFGEKFVENPWNFSQEDGERVSKEGIESSDELWQKHWFEVYNEVSSKFEEDFHKKSIEKQNPIEDNFEFLPKMLTNFKLNEESVEGSDATEDNSSKKPKQEDNSYEPTKSNRSYILGNSSVRSANSFATNNPNDSDSDEPPEERPIQIKREHESDSIDLSEECDQIQTEGTSHELIIKTRKKKKSKYWHQRYRLFSRFDEGIKLDNESWYSVTPERIAQHIANRFSQMNYFVIIDAFCGSGGNTIQFASISPFIKVIAIDIDERKIGFAKHNAKIYGVDHRIEFIVADYMLFAKSVALKVDAVFLSPPWGGPQYLKKKVYTLDMMTPKGDDVFQVTNTYITSNIGFLLPRNIDENELTQLAGEGKSVEVEKNLVNSKIKTVTAYFGDLIHSKSQ